MGQKYSVKVCPNCYRAFRLGQKLDSALEAHFAFIISEFTIMQQNDDYSFIKTLEFYNQIQLMVQQWVLLHSDLKQDWVCVT